MQRKYDRLLPFEEEIMAALGDRELHGLAIAEEMGMDRRHGLSKLYRALKRLAGPKMNRLESRLEPPRIAERERRPRRRLYRASRPQPRPPRDGEGEEE